METRSKAALKKRQAEVMEKVVAAYDPENSVEDDDQSKTRRIRSSTGISSDASSMALLLLLYTLQGIPMGLSGSIPLILKDRNASYEALSLFSAVSIPFSMKIIWAPLVDTYYFPAFGRRKTWLVPIQLITGVIMIFGAQFVQTWLREDGTDDELPDVYSLTFFFLLLYFLMATQDIAVDGWALTMLSRENVGYASACNAFGQALGIFSANQGLIALSDRDWCHNYLGLAEDAALVTLPGFMMFWGYVFILTTVILAVLKREDNAFAESEGEPMGLVATLQSVAAISTLPSVLSFLSILLTARAGFAAIDGAFTFKLQEYGMATTQLAAMAPATLAVTFLTPALASNAVANKPLSCFLYGMEGRIVSSLLMWLLLQAAFFLFPHDINNAHNHHAAGQNTVFFCCVMLITACNEACMSVCFLSLMAFFSRVSDPAIGGCYMTLLNTVVNLGSKWPSMLALYLLPKLTNAYCETITSPGIVLPGGCRSLRDSMCHAQQGHCVMVLDGFTILLLLGIAIQIVWMRYFGEEVLRLQSLPASSWMLSLSEMNSPMTPESQMAAAAASSSSAAATNGASTNGAHKDAKLK